jgi:hypothetical protein
MGSGGGGYGGGIYSSSDSPLTIVDCIISDNSASGGKGGVYYETGGAVEGAGGGWARGGGVYCGSVATVINNCSIVSNTATGGDGGQVDDPYGFDGDGGLGFGGGVCGQLAMSNCIIQGNEALRGSEGGIPPVMDSGGGGVCSLGSSSIENCLIVDNHIKNFYGSAVYHKHSGTFLIANCTIYGNTSEDPSVYAVTGTNITDSIIWGHGGYDVSGGSVTYSCTEQSISGTGNIHDEPRFVTGPLGNYYLSQTAAGQAVDSPCVDAGSDTAANQGMDIFTTRTDELKDKSIVDMGYHYSISPGSPDIDGDGEIDFFDYAWFSMGLFYETPKQIPRGSIVVDGDLSDWPGSVEWIELDKVYDSSPNDLTEARFALQWDANTNKVYAAVIVNDINHFFLDEYVSWDASDRIEVYSQGDAEEGAGWNKIYDVAQQYYVAPDTNGGNWAMWAEGETLGGDEGFEYAVDVNGAKIIYEVGVRQFDNYGGFSGGQTAVTGLHAGHVVGFDIVACTRWDTTNFGMLSENLMTYKYNDASRFAKYILVDEIFSADLDGNGANNYADLGILFESWPGCYVTEATNPYPTNNTIDVDPNVTLIWWPCGGAIYHDVYLGTDADAVANADHGSMEFMGTVSEAHYDPGGLYLGTYYWRIDEVGQMCLKQGEVWKFKTYEPLRNFSAVGWWKFDESGGSIAYDSAGNNDGTIYGATRTTGKINGALNFDGADDYVDCGNDASLDPGSGPFAVSAWIKTSVTNTNWAMILNHVGELLPQEVSIGIDVHKAFVWISGNGSMAGVFGTTNIEDGNWHYIVAVRDENNLYLYVDGICEGTPADATGVGDVVDSGLWTIGAANFADGFFMYGFFDGTIDEIAIYK